MHCAACERELEAFTGDVCPHCQHFAHPTRLGIYDDLELIKRGGMGSVYRARHPELGTVVAIKTVHASAGPETLAERFEQEARLAAMIPHPGVVRVFDFDCQEGRLYLVMEFVDGATLREAVDDAAEEAGRDLLWKIDKMIQLAAVLQAAHERGIIHRDIKPENVMVDTTGRVRVLDFGISRMLESDERLTQTGEILGTPEYIAPEQILDVPEAIDPRTDVYAAGVVLYELLTGRSPFAGHNVFQVLKNVESLQPPPPSHLRQGIPRGLDALTLECIAKEPAERPADCRVFGRRLRAILAEERGPTKQRSQLAWVAVAAVGIVSGWFLGQWSANNDERPAAHTEDTGAVTIRRILTESSSVDGFVLAAAIRAIPDDAPPSELYWRGMANKQTGAWFRSLRDFERAREGGYGDAAVEAAVLWVYTRHLFPMVVPGGGVLRSPFEGPPAGDELEEETDFAKAVSALARGEVQTAKDLLASAEITTSSDVEILRMLCAAQDPAAHSEILGQLGNLTDTTPLAHRVLRAALTGTNGIEQLEDVIQDLDRMSPIRYLLESAVAASRSDIDRRNAALELAQVAGEADFAVALFAATELDRYERLNRVEIETLSRLIDGILGATGTALKSAFEEKKNGK